MAVTYGEEMLAQAEAQALARARNQSMRKRRVRLLLPFLGATLWAMFDRDVARMLAFKDIADSDIKSIQSQIERMGTTNE